MAFLCNTTWLLPYKRAIVDWHVFSTISRMTYTGQTGELFSAGASGDLRTLGRSARVVAAVHTQDEFDMLFKLIFHHERRIAMRSIDAVEKISRKHPHFIDSHKEQLWALLNDDPTIDVKRHLVQIISRLELSTPEFRKAWSLLTHWAVNPNESRIVRVNSLQSLFELAERRTEPLLMQSFRSVVRSIERERVPSISARIRRLRNKYLQLHKASPKK